MFALILDKFYDGIYTEGSLKVDSFDKSLSPILDKFHDGRFSLK